MTLALPAQLMILLAKTLYSMGLRAAGALSKILNGPLLAGAPMARGHVARTICVQSCLCKGGWRHGSCATCRPAKGCHAAEHKARGAQCICTCFSCMHTKAREAGARPTHEHAAAHACARARTHPHTHSLSCEDAHKSACAGPSASTSRPCPLLARPPHPRIWHSTLPVSTGASHVPCAAARRKK